MGQKTQRRRWNYFIRPTLQRRRWGALLVLVGVGFLTFLRNLGTLRRAGEDGGLRTETTESAFAYDVDRWNRHKPKIVILAGPHKTASTSLQDFSVQLAGQSISLDDDNIDTPILPHPSNKKWIWPLPYSESSDGLPFRKSNKAKSHAALASFLTMRRFGFWFPKFKNFHSGIERKKFRARVEDYYRSLFRKAWESNKNILIAAEAFDAIVRHLAYDTDDDEIKKVGEDTHVPSDADKSIQTLMRLFVWDGSENDSSRRAPPRLEDFEVHVNYRLPRLDHVISIWHQTGQHTTLKTFFARKNQLWQLNSLALALQFVRRGIKTTIVDMKGVTEKEDRESAAGIAATAAEGTNIIKGLKGVVACDILQMDDGKGQAAVESDANSLWCDEHSWLHLPHPALDSRRKNTKEDLAELGLTEEALKQIDLEVSRYDCDVWKNLEPYISKGTLRILYPSKDLFLKCNPHAPAVSFLETLVKITAIARDDVIRK